MTIGTSLREAKGWSGVIAGRQSVVTVVHPITASGSSQPNSSPLARRRASTAAATVASTTAGIPTYQKTQSRECS